MAGTSITQPRLELGGAPNPRKGRMEHVSVVLIEVQGEVKFSNGQFFGLPRAWSRKPQNKCVLCHPVRKDNLSVVKCKPAGRTYSQLNPKLIRQQASEGQSQCGGIRPSAEVRTDPFPQILTARRPSSRRWARRDSHVKQSKPLKLRAAANIHVGRRLPEEPAVDTRLGWDRAWPTEHHFSPRPDPVRRDDGFYQRRFHVR